MTVRNYAILVTGIAVASVATLIACYAGKGWITFETAADLATVAATVVGTASLVAIAVQLQQQANQLKQQAQLARAANSQAFVNVSSEFTLNVTLDKELSELWHIKGAQYDALGEVDKARYRYLVQWWLTFFENLQYQHDCGLIDDAVYKAWEKDETRFVTRRNVAKIWPFVKDNYSDTFIEHFETHLR